MNVLSLFSGIGGLELGLERAGMTVIGQVEIDTFCQRVLAKHWPEVPRHDDVRTTVEWWRAEPRPVVDLACGGFPCQPVSVAGQRLAQADPRWLWPAFHSVVRALRPRYVLVENVPGLLNPWRDEDQSWNPAPIEEVIGDLAGLGYDAEWDCISAAHVGAPHLRRRVFVVAHPQRDGLWQQSVAQPWRSGQAVPGVNGAEELVANTACDGRQSWRPGDAQEEPRGRQPDRGRVGSIEVANADRDGQLQPGRTFSQVGRWPRDSGWWAVEPDVGRVADGVPARMDRTRALGNAVVPQVAEHVAGNPRPTAATTAGGNS